MIGSIDNAAVLEFREDGVLISSGVTYKVIESCSDVIIENNLLKYNTPVSVKTTITIKGTYNNYTAESSVDLLPADTSHILDPTKAD
jgi:hypothetical protein